MAGPHQPEDHSRPLSYQLENSVGATYRECRSARQWKGTMGPVPVGVRCPSDGHLPLPGRDLNLLRSAGVPWA
jgi:hypothetical protein